MATGEEIPGPDDRSGILEAAGGPPDALGFGYYTRVFLLLHAELERQGYSIEEPHPIRRRFWGLLPYRTYYPQEARQLVEQYLRTVEQELASALEHHCLAYWLHLYRRLSPEPIGANRQRATVGLVRATLECSVQKYAPFEPCDGVGITGDVSIEEVLGGILMEPDFRVEREQLETRPQLVLTRFSTADLRQFYDAEKLAYEVWRSSAMLRIIGKGAPIQVSDSDQCVFDLRSGELDRLVRVFDRRWGRWEDTVASATGVVFEPSATSQDKPGMEFLPTYNLGRMPLAEYSGFFDELSGLTFSGSTASNFIWFPFNLREYRDAHSPFAEAFAQKHGVDLDVLLTILTAACQRVWAMWRHGETPFERADAVVTHWQRAYEGPNTRDFLREEIAAFMPVAVQRLGLPERKVAEDELDAAFGFLELSSAKRRYIDLAYAGPHYPFLPYGSEHLFLDYAWIARRLYDLFLGVRINDQNFKGDALERVVRTGSSVLPRGACTARDAESRQIDASFALGDRLVIVECRAVWRSVAFDRGDPEAVRYRNQMIDKLLGDVDAKAHWLATRPVGANYDISDFVDILPVGVTPFAEYIPSLDGRYWLNDDLPRVLRPSELRLALEDGTLRAVSTNLVHISKAA